MIEFRAVSKRFGALPVLHNLSFLIPSGRVFFILGASGTGKSVALKCLTGLCPINAGTILLDGRIISGATEAEFRVLRRQLSLVAQLPALLDSRNLFENVTLGIRDRVFRERAQTAERCLEAVGLGELVEGLSQTFPSQLSYGQQKRIAIARSLALNPDWLLFDEPTTGLDPRTTIEIFRLIRTVADDHRKSVVVVSHDVRNALRFGDQLAFLEAGASIAQGTPDEIRASAHPLVREFLLEARA